jgi:hypothetical protein
MFDRTAKKMSVIDLLDIPAAGEKVTKPSALTKSGSAVARTILDQMGGMRRLALMLGMSAHAVEMAPRGVAFKWPNRQTSRGNKVRIDLTPADTYTMTFLSSTAHGEKPVKVYRDVYAEDLVPIFEKQTGWYLRL